MHLAVVNPRRAARGAIACGMRSAGLLLHRRTAGGLEVFIVHPGGPYFARKDDGVWSIPKGEIDGDERPLDVARREFEEETGQTLEACGGTGEPHPLGEIRQAGGKYVEAWAVEGDWPAGAELVSNTFTLEWPPRSGTMKEFPEVDRGGFVPLAEARRKLNPAQVEFLDRLVAWLASG
jgi:predicted NUDIX family NTP pyrophosphohydrolase